MSSENDTELLFGLAKAQHPKQLSKLIHEFLIRIEVMSWDSTTAQCYAKLRAELQKKGQPLGNLDMLIAAHALALDITLVTQDRAFKQISGLKTEDWIHK